MIGTKSFLLELVPLIVLPIVIAVSTGVLVKRRKRFWLFVAGLAIVMLLLMGIRYFYQVGHHNFLAKLAIDDVASIRIDKTTVTDPTSLRTIIHTLNNRQWFSPNHGGWADKVDFIVTLRSGEERRFWVGYYLRQPGAVIEFHRGAEKGYWTDGYAFSPDLPGALANAGTKLPKQP